MRVAVIGGTGYIGRAVVEQLVGRGDTPIVVSRFAASSPELEARPGDVRDPDALAAAVQDADAVIHAAAPAGDWDTDRAAVESLLESLAGRRFLYTSGIWSLGPAAGDSGADEGSTPDPLPISRGRPMIERLIIDAARRDTAGIVIRPGIVYGHGGGIPGMLVDWAREYGSGRYVGERPDIRWPMVQVDDLAALYVRALDHADPGAMLHATSQSGVAVGDLAAAADRAAGGSGTATAWPFDDAADVLGRPFAEALVHDQVVVSPAAEKLGWQPQHRDAVAEIAAQEAE